MWLCQLVSACLQRAGKERARLVVPTSGKKPVYRARPALEILEDRTLLAVWAPIGPSPQHDPNKLSGNSLAEDFTGRVSALAISSVTVHRP